MAAVAWPSTLPVAPLRNGLRIAPQDNLVRSQTGTGPGKARRRASKAPINVTCSIYVEGPGRAEFIAFYRSHLLDGALRFTWRGLDDAVSGTIPALNPDPDLLNPSLWYQGGSSLVSISDGKVSPRAFRGSTNGFSNYINHTDGTHYPEEQWVPYTPSRAYRFSYWLRGVDSPPGGHAGYMAFRDGDGEFINAGESNWRGSNATHPRHYIVSTSTPANPEWTYYEILFGAGQPNAPAARAIEMGVGALINYNTPADSGTMEIQGFRIEDAGDGRPRINGARHTYQFMEPPVHSPLGTGWQIDMVLQAW